MTYQFGLRFRCCRRPGPCWPGRSVEWLERGPAAAVSLRGISSRRLSGRPGLGPSLSGPDVGQRSAKLAARQPTRSPALGPAKWRDRPGSLKTVPPPSSRISVRDAAAEVASARQPVGGRGGHVLHLHHHPQPHGTQGGGQQQRSCLQNWWVTNYLNFIGAFNININLF